jgi:DNA-binding CsgD family transcriptional regulator
MSDGAPHTFADDDVRSVVKLLGEVAAMSDDIPIRRRGVCDGLAKLIDADIWFWLMAKDEPGSPDPAAFAFIEGGWLEAEAKQHDIFHRSMFTDDVRFINAKITGKSYHATNARPQLVADKEWESSNLLNHHFRPAGINEFIFSIYPLENHILSSIFFQRRTGKPPFGPREQALTHLVIGQIEWLHRADLKIEIAQAVPSLTRRQRQVMFMLLEGEARKRIAHRLRISPYTVADHIQTIYQHFGVNSQSELVAHFYRGGRQQNPSA